MSSIGTVLSYLWFSRSFIVARYPGQSLRIKGHKSWGILLLLLTVLLSGCRTQSYPQMSADITGSLFRALQKKQVFGLTVVRRDNPSWRSLQLNGEPTYTLDQLSAIHEKLKCDGILVGTITEFRPYPHMAVGLRLKLLDLRDGQLLWALEQIWDSADKTVEKRTKNYFESEKREGFAPLREQLTAVSPLEFIKFVSYEVAETL
ncbi:MAG: hypothetical protein ACYSW0_03710 [Planctomycetota bacterium]|jgi:hypothetical protein